MAPEHRDPADRPATPSTTSPALPTDLPARDADTLHVPVLLNRIADLLAPALQPTAQRPHPVLVDGTLGMGGHTIAYLERFPDIRVIGLDRDPQALAVAASRLAARGLTERATLVHTTNDGLADAVATHSPGGVQGVLFDLGVSSLQLDEVDRGFAYAVDAPLDMRMDPTTGPTAADVLNTYAPGDLVRLLREYGEEKFATRIVSVVVKERAREPFTTSARLVELVRTAIPAAARRTGGHPAKRTFQALRVEVNDELGVLRRAVPQAVDALTVGGRLVVMSFQSLEDRIAKAVLVPRTKSTAPVDLPFVPAGHEPELKLLTRGAEAPTEVEIRENSRAASARIRAVERLRSTS